MVVRHAEASKIPASKSRLFAIWLNIVEEFIQLIVGYAKEIIAI